MQNVQPIFYTHGGDQTIPFLTTIRDVVTTATAGSGANDLAIALTAESERKNNPRKWLVAKDLWPEGKEGVIFGANCYAWGSFQFDGHKWGYWAW